MPLHPTLHGVVEAMAGERQLVEEYFRSVWIEGGWDRVDEFVSASYVNHGSVSGLPSTTIEDGKIAEEWRIVDNTGLLEQLRKASGRG